MFEDDDLIRQMLEKALERLGCEVQSYANPGLCPLMREEACPCQLARVCADLIISDLNMPAISGLELVASLQKHGCRLQRYLLASGSWSEAQKESARRMGCEVVEKPFDLEFIRNWVNQCRLSIDPGRSLIDWESDTEADARRAR